MYFGVKQCQIIWLSILPSCCCEQMQWCFWTSPHSWYSLRNNKIIFARCKILTLNVVLRSFSIQLKFPRGQKISPDFRTEHAQLWHLKNRAEKDERKKVENFQLSWRILEKKNYQPIKFKQNANKHSERWRPTTWKQLFAHPMWLTKPLSGIEYGCTTKNNNIKKLSTNNNKISSNSHQKMLPNIQGQIYTRKDLCWCLFLIKLQVFSLQLYQIRDPDTGVFLSNY